MLCPFCQQACLPSNFYALQEGVEGLKCVQHPYIVEIMVMLPKPGFSGDPSCHYCYTVSRQRSDGELQEFFLEYLRVGEITNFTLHRGNSKRRTDILLDLDYIPPHITPDTIDQKLPIILTFL